MSKIVISLIFFANLFISALAQTITDCQVEGLKGRPKTMLEEQADLANGSVSPKKESPYVINTIAWDKRGYEIERVMFGSNPVTKKREPTLNIIATYDTNQMIRTERSYKPKVAPSQGVPPSLTIIGGKPPNAAPPVKSEPDGASVSEIVYKTDGKGNREEESSYAGLVKGGKPQSRTIYRWDNQGRKQEVWLYIPTDKLVSKSIHKYDANGNEVERLDYDNSGKQTSRETYSDYRFDPQGNWVSRKVQMEYGRNRGVSVIYRTITYWE